MIEEIRAYYDSHDEDGRFLPKHGRVEFLTTMRYIERYLKPGARVCEIGAGTGRYSHEIARMGYRVDAVELVEKNIEIFRAHTRAWENVTIAQGDARDISFLPDGAYDVTLLLGPMYHLFTEKDKRAALSEAVRVTKRGGILMVAYCVADPSVLMHGFIRGNIHSLIEIGLVDPETFHASSRPQEVFELHRKEDIDRLMADFPTERLYYIATDLYTRHMDGAVDAMDEETFELYVKYHLTICERPDMVGLSHHTLDIRRKE